MHQHQQQLAAAASMLQRIVQEAKPGFLVTPDTLRDAQQLAEQLSTEIPPGSAARECGQFHYWSDAKHCAIENCSPFGFAAIYAAARGYSPFLVMAADDADALPRRRNGLVRCSSFKDGGED